MDKQRTIKREVELDGIGLHMGNKARMKFKPAPINSGINFIRIDLETKPSLRAQWDSVLPESFIMRRTSLGNGQVQVYTVEHIMAAISGLDIDNLNIEITNNEIPGFDGSAQIMVEALNKAGIEEQDSPRNYFILREPVYVQEEDASIIALPAPEFRISYQDIWIIKTNQIVLKMNLLLREHSVWRRRQMIYRVRV